MPYRRCLVVLLALAASCALSACQPMYYGTMEAFGQHKRDILVDRVEKARDEQVEAKEQFQSALDEFLAVTQVGDSELSERYDRLKKELERSESRASGVHKRIEDIEDVSDALFREWEKELDQYSSPELRSLSEDQLFQTKARYSELIGAMKRAESKMEPVLLVLRDQVLYLKHNLNAQAIAALQGTRIELESDIGELISEMQAAIDEANAFIASMDGAGVPG